MARRYPPKTMRASADTLAAVLVTNHVDDLPSDLALACVVGFHMRAAFASTNARHRFRLWALGGDR